MNKTILWCLVLVLACIDLQLGPTELELDKALTQVLASIKSFIIKDISMATTNNIAATILIEIRLPRTLLAICVGAGLALSGAAMQSLLRNPLASPDLLGLSQGAVLGAVLTLYWGFSSIHPLILPLTAIASALALMLLLIKLSSQIGRLQGLILAGIALSAVLSAFTALALNLAPNPYALQEIYFWLLGSVANRSFPDVFILLPCLLLGGFLLLRETSTFDALSLGENTAATLGFPLTQRQPYILTGLGLCIGACVAVSGSIAFVGLLVPHFVRGLARGLPSRVLVLSIPAGAALLLLADICVQMLPTAQELQLGVLTAGLGGPFFLWLLLGGKRQWL
jgi:iron complex transport system permease protein